MTTRGWIGYDWFKLVVAIILAILLLVFGLQNGASNQVGTGLAATAPAANAAASTQQVPALTTPLAGAALAAGTTSLSGTGEPGATIRVLVDGTAVGTTTVGGDGTWQLDVALDTPGTRNITVETIDAAGNMLNQAAPVALTVAAPTAQAAAAAATSAATAPTEASAAPTSVPTAAPTEAATVAAATPTEAPAVAATAPATPLRPTLLSPTGLLAEGPTTLSGTGVPGTQVEILINGQLVGSTTVAANGTWSLPATFAAGANQVSVRIPGDPSSASIPVLLTVAVAEVPTAVAPTAVSGGAAAITTPVDGTQVAAGTFRMAGTGTPGGRVEVLDGDKVVGTTTVNADGTWSLDLPAPEGTAAYTARPVGSSETATTAIRITSGEVKICPTIAVGCNAWVTRQGGLRLRLRSGPGTSSAIITLLPIGTQMLLTAGPQAADGFNWYKVTTVGGEEGWVAGEQVRLQPD